MLAPEEAVWSPYAKGQCTVVIASTVTPYNIILYQQNSLVIHHIACAIQRHYIVLLARSIVDCITLLLRHVTRVSYCKCIIYIRYGLLFVYVYNATECFHKANVWVNTSKFNTSN